jgi:transcriptional regulator with XRE-family HTH domain
MTLLSEAGRALYGTQWQSDLARALDVNPRTVRRWASGEDIPRLGVYADLLALCDNRAKELKDIRKRIEGLAASG